MERRRWRGCACARKHTHMRAQWQLCDHSARNCIRNASSSSSMVSATSGTERSSSSSWFALSLSGWCGRAADAGVRSLSSLALMLASALSPPPRGVVAVLARRCEDGGEVTPVGVWWRGGVNTLRGFGGLAYPRKNVRVEGEIPPGPTGGDASGVEGELALSSSERARGLAAAAGSSRAVLPAGAWGLARARVGVACVCLVAGGGVKATFPLVRGRCAGDAGSDGVPPRLAGLPRALPVFWGRSGVLASKSLGWNAPALSSAPSGSTRKLISSAPSLLFRLWVPCVDTCALPRGCAPATDSAIWSARMSLVDACAASWGRDTIATGTRPARRAVPALRSRGSASRGLPGGGAWAVGLGPWSWLRGGVGARVGAGAGRIRGSSRCTAGVRVSATFLNKNMPAGTRGGVAAAGPAVVCAGARALAPALAPRSGCGVAAFAGGAAAAAMFPPPALALTSAAILLTCASTDGPAFGDMSKSCSSLVFSLTSGSGVPRGVSEVWYRSAGVGGTRPSVALPLGVRAADRGRAPCALANEGVCARGASLLAASALLSLSPAAPAAALAALPGHAAPSSAPASSAVRSLMDASRDVMRSLLSWPTKNRSINSEWRPVRFHLLTRRYALCGPSATAGGLTESRKPPTVGLFHCLPNWPLSSSAACRNFRCLPTTHGQR